MRYREGMENCERIRTSILRSMEGEVFWQSPGRRASSTTKERKKRAKYLMRTSTGPDYLRGCTCRCPGMFLRRVEIARTNGWPGVKDVFRPTSRSETHHIWFI